MQLRVVFPVLRSPQWGELDFSCTCRAPHAQPHLHLLFTAQGMELQNTLPGVFRGQTQRWEADSAKMKTENCKSRFCLKAGYEMAHNFTLPEDPKTGAISSSSYGYIASLFRCCADLPSWPKPLETGLRPCRSYTMKAGAERCGCTSPALSFIVCWNLESQYRQVSV